MRNTLLIAMLAACGLFFAMRWDAASPSAHAAAPAASMLPAASSSAPNCDGAAISVDATSCSTGGWHATGTCCSTSTGPKERWTRGSSTKCCGACFTP